MKSPNHSALTHCINLLSHEMGQQTLPNEVAEQLIEYVLYRGSFNGSTGISGWQIFTNHMITQRELRNLLMAHAATRISQFNDQEEPAADKYLSHDLCLAFEQALFGHPADRLPDDLLDAWEQ